MRLFVETEAGLSIIDELRRMYMKNTKRILTAILAVILLFAICVSSAFAERIVQNPGDLGDVNGDGKINLKDIASALKDVAGWEMGEEYIPESADVSCDGKVTLVDVSMNMKLISGWYDISDGGLIVEFFWEWE